MQRSIIILSLLIALASPATARPFRWQVKKDQRFAVQWRSSDWRSFPLQTEVKSAVDMDWLADEDILGTGALKIVLKRIQWSFENHAFKISLDWRPDSPMKSLIKKKRHWSDDQSSSVEYFQSAIEGLTKAKLIVLLQANGHYGIVGAEFKDHPDQAPKIPLFESMLPMPNSEPLDPELLKGGLLDIEKLPQFYACESPARDPLPYALIISENGSLLLSMDQSRNSARSRESVGIECTDRCRPFRETSHERCQSELKFRHEFSAGFLKSSELRLNTRRFEVIERDGRHISGSSEKAGEWLRLSTSLNVQAR